MPKKNILTMPYGDKPLQFPTQIINIGLSTSALFDTRKSDKIFQECGEKEYMRFMAARKNTPLKPGPAFQFAKKMLALNDSTNVVVNLTLLSRNNPFVARRINTSITANNLTFKNNGGRQIFGEAYTGGAPITPGLLNAFGVDLFLSTKEADVKNALAAGCAAGLVSNKPRAPHEAANDNCIRLAFDFDRVIGVAKGLPGDTYQYDSERYFREYGLSAYHIREKTLADHPAEPGPLAPFFLKIESLRNKLSQQEGNKGAQIELHIVTARAGTALMRVLTTMDAWGIETKSLVSCGTTSKSPQLKNLKADIFFDDSERHITAAPQNTLAALVPWTDAPEHPEMTNSPVKDGSTPA